MYSPNIDCSTPVRDAFWKSTKERYERLSYPGTRTSFRIVSSEVHKLLNDNEFPASRVTDIFRQQFFAMKNFVASLVTYVITPEEVDFQDGRNAELALFSAELFKAEFRWQKYSMKEERQNLANIVAEMTSKQSAKQKWPFWKSPSPNGYHITMIISSPRL